MTQAELRYLESMPYRMAEIEKQLEKLNQTMALIAQILNNPNSTK